MLSCEKVPWAEVKLLRNGTEGKRHGDGSSGMVWIEKWHEDRCIFDCPGGPSAVVDGGSSAIEGHPEGILEEDVRRTGKEKARMVRNDTSLGLARGNGKGTGKAWVRIKDIRGDDRIGSDLPSARDSEGDVLGEQCKQ